MLTYFMMLSSSETTKKIHQILWNLKFHYCCQKSPPVAPVLQK